MAMLLYQRVSPVSPVSPVNDQHLGRASHSGKMWAATLALGEPMRQAHHHISWDGMQPVSYNVGPPRQLSWCITPITMVYDTCNNLVTIPTGVYEPTKWGRATL